MTAVFQVIAVAMIFSCIFKKYDDDNEDPHDPHNAKPAANEKLIDPILEMGRYTEL